MSINSKPQSCRSKAPLKAQTAESRFTLGRIPAYVLVVLLVMAAAQLLCYYLTRLALPRLTLHILTGPLDARIPFSPPWVTVYFLSFPFWICTALWFLSESRAYAYRLCSAYVLAMLLCAMIYLIWPGTMVRPEIAGGGFFDKWMRFLYRVDAPTNLCPSLHVLITWFCWRGTLGCRGIPRWYKLVSFVFFLAVCCAVLLVKQHALIDVPCGLLVGELSMQCARLCRLERIPFRIENHFRKE